MRLLDALRRLHYRLTFVPLHVHDEAYGQWQAEHRAIVDDLVAERGARVALAGETLRLHVELGAERATRAVVEEQLAVALADLRRARGDTLPALAAANGNGYHGPPLTLVDVGGETHVDSVMPARKWVDLLVGEDECTRTLAAVPPLPALDPAPTTAGEPLADVWAALPAGADEARHWIALRNALPPTEMVSSGVIDGERG